MSGGRLDGRVAIVTGAGSGIGQGIALRFAEEGASVAVNDLSDDRAAGTVDEIRACGGQAASCSGDVTQRSTAEALVATSLAEFGRLDALVNNAGILTFSSFLDMTDDEWDRVMHINVRSVYVCTQVAARHWVQTGTPGKVVNIASTQAEMASPAGLSHYCASKGAVRMLTRSTALELAPHNITVNAIGPGTVPTGIASGQVVRAADITEQERSSTSIVPIGRMGTPRDIANMALFMCTGDADYMTGQLVMLDGGRNLSAGDVRSAAPSQEDSR